MRALNPMQHIDLSHPLVDGGPVFPNDPPLSVKSSCTIASHRYNLSQVTMGTHTGTHLDAMGHFFDDGRTLDQMPLDWFHGPARLLRMPKAPNADITPEDLRPHEEHLKPGAKVILNTGWHREFGTPRFFEAAPSMTLDAARYLASRRIRLLGMDLPTPGRQGLELHHILLAKDVEIVLVEALANLDALPEDFTFMAFPLNFKGRDGSPVRAVAVCP